MSNFTRQGRRANPLHSSSASRRKAQNRALCIEGLEERIVLSTITWNNRAANNGGSWDTPGNWVNSVVPGPNDDAVINLGAGTVTFATGNNDSVHSVTTNSTTNLAISSGSLNIASASSIGGLTLSGGTLGGGGSLTVKGATTWTGGTMTGSGTTEAQGALTLGFGTGNTASTLYLAGGRALINDAAATGAANGAGVTLDVSDGSTITNKSTATFTFTSNSAIVNNGGSPSGGTFINQGTLGTNGGTGTSTVGIPITNTGTLQALTGILSVGAGGTFSSASKFTASSGAKIGFGGGTFSIPSGATLSGAGGLLVTGATVSFGGTYSAAGPAEIDSGEIDFNTTASLGSLTLAGGTLGGSAAVTVNGQTTWSGGTITGSGSIEAKAGLALGNGTGNTASTLALTGGRSLINDAAASGAANGSGFTMGVSGGSTITNKSGATFTFTSDSSITNSGGSPSGGSFTNQGTLGANGGAGTSTIGIAVSNTGTISVLTGTLNLTGAFSNFNAGTSTLTGGTYLVTGYLEFANAKILTNNAAIVLNTNSSDIRDSNGVGALATYAVNNTASGSITLQNGKNLSVGSLANAGALSGSGTVTGNVTNSGTISPGGIGTAGSITINGTYAQTSSGTLAIDIGGPTSVTQYDLLAISGTASLNGTLAVSTINGYAPASGVSFRPLTFASKTGDFSTETGLDLGTVAVIPEYDGTGLNLVTNTKPTVPHQTPSIDSNGSSSFQLTATDAESASSTLKFTITSLPSGTLSYGGTPVAVGQSFTGSPVALTYQIPSVIFGNYTDSFTFTVTDPGGAVTDSTVNLSLATPMPGVAEINGTSGDDTILAANNGGNLQVTINGVVTNTGVPLTSITQMNVFGHDGNDTIEVSGLALNTNIDGGTGTNSLILDGTSGADTFTLGGDTSIGFNGATITGTSPFTVNGLGGNDTFNINTADLGATLNGGDGNDSFILAAGASLGTPLDGGTGTNTIDESAITTPVTLNIATSTVSGLLSAYTNIQSVIGGTASNTLTGPSAGSTYQITGANAGNVGGTAFTGFGKITAGSGNDSFVFSNGATLSGTLDGGSGSNTIDESAYTSAVVANPEAGTATGVGTTFSGVQTFIGSATAGGTLTGPSASSTYTITSPNAGTVGVVSFSNYGSIVAGAGNDLFKFSNGASLSGSLDGGGGTLNKIDDSLVTTPIALNLASSTLTGIASGFANIQSFIGGTGANSITGPNGGATFKFTGTNAGTVSGFNFNKIGTVIGGSGDDVFKFSSVGLLTGSISGGGGSNTLDYSALTTQVTLNLASTTVSRVLGTFAKIQTVLAGTFAGNPLTGPTASTVFNVTGANSGNVAGINFSNFSRLVGGAGDDTFKLSDGASISGSIEGSAGTNVIDESAYSTPVNVNFQTSTLTGLGLPFSNIRSVIGGTASNILTGPSSASTYSLAGSNAGSVSINGSGIEGTHYFNGFGSLTGGAGGDTFVFSPTAVLSSSIIGGGGTNTIDDSALSSLVTLNLQASTVSRVLGTISGIQSVIGGSFNGNQLLGSNASTTYNITGANSGNAGGTAFSNFGVIIAGTASSNFVFSKNASLSGLIEGEAGTNTIDASAETTPVALNFDAATVTLNGVALTYRNIRSITGGSAANTLTGPSAGSTYTITGSNNVSVGGMSFNKFANLVGGAGDDTFALSASAVLSGGIDGGGGSNTIDESALTSQVTLNLANSTVSRVANPLANIQSVIGGSFSGNQILGSNASTTYNVTGANAGNVNGLSFSGFGRIVGGSGNDTFILSNGAGLSNGLDGGLGSNSLNYGAYAAAINVNLDTGAATGFGAMISNIRNVIGGSGNDTLTGNSVGNVLVGGAGNDTISGGSGRSLLIGGNGADLINGGSSDDILINGTTTYDNNLAALDSILAEWKTGDSYATRIGLLKNGGGLNGSNTLVSGTTVTNDTSPDILNGNAGNDWFLEGTGDVADNQPGEQIN